MPKVSVIIPIYGVEKYIERCAVSLFEQTIDDIEYVFVDDNTIDNSITILYNVMSRYPNRKSQVKIIAHKLNRGVAQARITGIQNATGDYVIHCDGDDWVDANMYEMMYRRALIGDYDMVVCDYANIYDHYSNICTPCYSSDFLQSLLLCKCTGSLCNKLVRRELLLTNNFVYPTSSYCEDYVYSIQFAIDSQRVDYIPIPFYNYCHREGSQVTSQNRKAIDRRIRENLENYSLVEKILDERDLSSNYSSELIALKLIVKNSIRMYIDQPGYYKLWIRTFPELTYEMFKSKYITWRSIVAYFLTMFGLYSLIKKHLHNA